MIYKLARYYYYKFYAPEFIDFVNHGLGIETRSADFKDQWQPHLKASKDFQLTAIKNLFDIKTESHKDLCVLGAGRLLDFPAQEYSELFNHITLIDADPACCRIWKKFRNKSKASVDWQLLDLTSRLESWTKQLSEFLQGDKSTSKVTTIRIKAFLSDLVKQKKVNNWSPPNCDVLVSLNLLSQLSVYWRDRATDLINKHAPYLLDANQELSKEIEASLVDMDAVLEKEHLSLLSDSNAKLIIIIYDNEFYYYTNSQSDWQVEKALTLNSRPELSGYKVEYSKCWLWHLVPQGYESRDHGEIHRVEALAFIKS